MASDFEEYLKDSQFLRDPLQPSFDFQSYTEIANPKQQPSQPVILAKQDKIPTSKTPSNDDQVDLSLFFKYPQRKAAQMLGLPSSTLSKRWREASGKKQWPYRDIRKIERKLKTLLTNSETMKSLKGDLNWSEEVMTLKKHKEEQMKSTFIRKNL